MDYSLSEHQFRFAAWAASRAASTSIVCRFPVSTGFKLLRHAQVHPRDDICSSLHDAISSSEKFDLWHDKKCLDICCAATAAETKGFTYGIAAKLLNVYLKALTLGCVCGQSECAQIRTAIHPPIDRLLLDKLVKEDDDIERKRSWRLLRDKAWSKFERGDYQSCIKVIREKMENKGLWEIDQFWTGHQGE